MPTTSLAGSFDKEIVDYVLDMVDLMDEFALKQLSECYENDLQKLVDVLFVESKRVLETESLLDSSMFSGMTEVSNSVENTLRSANLNYFITSVLPHFDMNWHHVEWGNMIQFFRFLCILAARGHGKSYWGSFAYILWKMYRFHKRKGFVGRTMKEYEMSEEGILVTNEYGLAKHLLSMVKEEIEYNEILNPILMPEKKGEGWGAERITAKNGAKLITKSFGSKMRGYHPTYIVVDDFLNESSLYSKEQREKYWNVFSAVLMNMIEPQGQVLTIGTPFHEEDLYAQLKKGGEFKVFEYPAVMPDGSILWPEKHSLDDIISKRKQQGAIIFTREILVKPVSDESSIFPYTILRNSFRGMDQVKLAPNIESHSRKFKRVVIGCDFGISASVGADYSVFTVMGVDELENYHLINMWRKRGATHHQQMAALRMLNANFKPDIIYAEDNGMQKIFIEMMEDANLPVVGVTTGINKKDLYKGLPSIAVLFEQGKIKFPRGDEKARAVTDLYCSELNSITFTDKGKLESVSGHDDSSMSLWQALRGCRHGTEFEWHI